MRKGGKPVSAHNVNCISAAKHLSNKHKALDLIPSTTEDEVGAADERLHRLLRPGGTCRGGS